MKTRARRISRNKSAIQIKPEAEELDTGSAKKPALTVISHDETVSKPGGTVRPKVNTYPKRIKEVVRVEMKAANSNLPAEVELPGAIDLDSPEDKAARAAMNQPAGTSFDWSFTLWLVALVVAVNLALLILVGSPSKPGNDKVSTASATPAATEEGVVVPVTAVEEPASAVVVKPVVSEVKPATVAAPVMAAPVAVVVPAPQPAAAASQPVEVAAQPVPVVSAKSAKPAPDLLSIINQN